MVSKGRGRGAGVEFSATSSCTTSLCMRAQHLAGSGGRAMAGLVVGRCAHVSGVGRHAGVLDSVAGEAWPLAVGVVAGDLQGGNNTHPVQLAVGTTICCANSVGHYPTRQGCPSASTLSAAKNGQAGTPSPQFIPGSCPRRSAQPSCPPCSRCHCSQQCRR